MFFASVSTHFPHFCIFVSPFLIMIKASFFVLNTTTILNGRKFFIPSNPIHQVLGGKVGHYFVQSNRREHKIAVPEHGQYVEAGVANFPIPRLHGGQI